jgi:hypothetical protein
MPFQQEYAPLTASERFQYVLSELSRLLDTIESHLTGSRRVRMIRYSDLGPPPRSYGTFFFSPAYLPEKPEPPEAVLFRSMGMWLAPIAVLWVILLLLSVRSARLLPNKRLHLTEQGEVKSRRA